VPLPEHVPPTVEVHPRDIRVCARHPRRVRRRRRGETHGLPGGSQLLEDPVQHGEVIGVLVGLQRRPGEDVHRERVDTRLLEERHVPVPDVLGPLLRVVVATETNLVHV